MKQFVFFIKPKLNETELNNKEKIWDDFESKTKIKISNIWSKDLLDDKPS